MSKHPDSPDLNFILSQTDSRPMYLQIMDQVQQRVAVGDWSPGTKLPSIRELAVATKVSMITVKRAYRELEHDGVIVTQQGKGSWIAEPDKHGSLQQAELERYLKQAVALAAAMGLSAADLQNLLAQHIKD